MEVLLSGHRASWAVRRALSYSRLSGWDDCHLQHNHRNRPHAPSPLPDHHRATKSHLWRRSEWQSRILLFAARAVPHLGDNAYPVNSRSPNRLLNLVSAT